MKITTGFLGVIAALGLNAAVAQDAESEYVAAEESVSEFQPVEETIAEEVAPEAEAAPESYGDAAESYGEAADSYASDTAASDAYSSESTESYAAEGSVAETVSERTELVAPSYIGIMGYGVDPDKDRTYKIPGYDTKIDHGVGFDLFYGYQGQNRFGYEIHGFSQVFETGDDLRTDFYRYGLGADLTYSFGDRTGFTPFILVGGGGNYNDVFPAEDKLSWFANAGIGFVTGPFIQTGQLRLRGEARYVYDDFEDGYGDIRYALGIEIPLFAERSVEMAALEPQVKVVEVATGLKDTDGDGIIDDKDQCPDTPAGERVDGNGCPLGKVIALKGVTFEFNKTRLRPDAQTILDWATDILKKYPDMQVEVAGHTDSVGGDAYNQKLSEGRAGAVRDYFVEKGVPEAQVTVKGYGEAEPVADNGTEAGRELNRRVELRVLN